MIALFEVHAYQAIFVAVLLCASAVVALKEWLDASPAGGDDGR